MRLAAGFIMALVVGKLAAAWLSGRIFDLEGAEVGLMFSMLVAQAAATLAARPSSASKRVSTATTSSTP
jgi:hypothetical protein